MTDIADPAFDASAYGRTQEELMARIHARVRDGSLVDGVEVFRLMYAVSGRDGSRRPLGGRHHSAVMCYATRR